jgi:hypothetical protein
MRRSNTASHLTTEQLHRLRRIRSVARVMDTAVRVPILGVRIGADSLMGLLPVVGDAAGALIGLAIFNEARRLGLPRDKLAKMLLNLGIDASAGSIPLVGDVFDVYFKSHRRNFIIMMDHFGINEHDLDDR